MSVTIDFVHAIEILDSRGRPTVSVVLRATDGTETRAGVPSGASTGSGEAVELRDGDAARHDGKGTRAAVGNVNGPIAEALSGRTFSDLADLDRLLIELDGTENKSSLGANAIVGVSMAAVRAFATSEQVDLWQCLTPPGVTATLPVPHFNVVNGGAHAPNTLDFQEVMLAPWRRTSPTTTHRGVGAYLDQLLINIPGLDPATAGTDAQLAVGAFTTSLLNGLPR